MRKFLGILLAAVTLVLFTAIPAQALDGPHYWMYSNDGGFNGARLDFWARGDHTIICDNDADGASAHMRVYYKYDGQAVPAFSLKASGKGNCNHKDPGDGGRYDLPENCLIFNVWIEKDGDYVDGSSDWAKWDNDNNIKNNCNF